VNRCPKEQREPHRFPSHVLRNSRWPSAGQPPAANAHPACSSERALRPMASRRQFLLGSTANWQAPSAGPGTVTAASPLWKRSICQSDLHTLRRPDLLHASPRAVGLRPLPPRCTDEVSDPATRPIHHYGTAPSASTPSGDGPASGGLSWHAQPWGGGRSVRAEPGDAWSLEPGPAQSVNPSALPATHLMCAGPLFPSQAAHTESAHHKIEAEPGQSALFSHPRFRD